MISSRHSSPCGHLFSFRYDLPPAAGSVPREESSGSKVGTGAIESAVNDSVSLIEVTNSDSNGDGVEFNGKNDDRMIPSEVSTELPCSPIELLNPVPVIVDIGGANEEQSHRDLNIEECNSNEVGGQNLEQQGENVEQPLGEQSSEQKTSTVLNTEISSGGLTEEQRAMTSSKKSDDYMDSRDVAEYLEKLQEERDNYVDEDQVEKYLKELSLEKSEEELLGKVDVTEEENKVDDIFHEVTEQDTNETGARPKILEDTQTDLNVIENTQLDMESLEKDLEPTITVTRAAGDEVGPGHYVEEAEYVDLESLGAELEPTIQVEEELSPPPYSEVDPMTTGEES